MEERLYKRVLQAPELNAVRQLIFHSSEGSSLLSLFQLAITDANLASRIQKHPEKVVSPGVFNWPKHLCASVTQGSLYYCRKACCRVKQLCLSPRIAPGQCPPPCSTHFCTAAEWCEGETAHLAVFVLSALISCLPGNFIQSSRGLNAKSWCYGSR